MDGDPTYADLTQTMGWSGMGARAVAPQGEESIPPAGKRYTEGQVLGVGGMGKVSLAHDARIGREVALKELRADRDLGPEERARFLREARVQGQLEHPSIVPVYDIDRRADGTTFFTMRRVLGRTLLSILEDLRRGDAAAKARYTQRELLTAFATICLTIDYAHTRGVIHRDLKPANLMLGDFGEVYVLDWGLARLVGEASEREPAEGRISIPGELMGTPLYMAPEQMQDPAVGVAADVFALGAILFEILTLEKLRTAQTLYLPANARMSERAPDLGIAPELETICVRATETDPADRYATPRALQEAIVRYLEGDREVAQRKALAAKHAERARAALAEEQRGVAIRELNLALGLDPTNTEHATELGQILTKPPRDTPIEVQEQMRRENDRIVRSGVTHSIIGMVSWFVFLPVLMIIGVHDWTLLGAAIVPAGIALLASIAAMRQKPISRWIQIVTIAGMMAAAMVVSRLYGPLVLGPTLIASYAIVLQAHPARMFRRIAMIGGVIAMVLPLVLEVAGLVPASYLFEGGRLSILPQAVELPQTGTLALLGLANAAMIVVPGRFIAELRQDLTTVQARQLTQAWQFKQLAARV